MNQNLSVKDWIITVIISMIPVVGFIMVIYWGFVDQEANINKKNWAKALVYIYIASIVLAFVAFFILGAVGIIANLR